MGETFLFDKRWQQVKQEILLHQRDESEKAGHDIGWDFAAVDWRVRHRHTLDKENNNSGR
jgi:hypothetical protein